MGHILIIDDEEMVRCSLDMILRTQGWRTELADGGVDGLAKARRSPPDLIMCDLNMHRTSGLQVLAELRQDVVLKSVPVLMMTGSEGEEAEQKALALGACAVVLKPFNHDELVRMVETVLRGGENACST
jgi:two-component system response regulator PrrA